jgi:hypothetical protein
MFLMLDWATMVIRLTDGERSELRPAVASQPQFTVGFSQ